LICYSKSFDMYYIVASPLVYHLELLFCYFGTWPLFL